MNKKTLLDIEASVTSTLRKRREGVRGQGRLDVLLLEALDLIQSPLYSQVLKDETHDRFESRSL